MPRARPEIAIHLAAIGVLVAVGVTRLRAGQLLIGGACIGVAVAVVAWVVVRFVRASRD